MRPVQQPVIQTQQPVAAPTAPPTPPTSPTPAPTGPAPVERLLRTGIHTIVFVLGCNILQPVLGGRPLGQHILTAISPGYFLPFSVGLSAGLNADRLAATLLALIITIGYWPDNLTAPATAAIAGIITGLGARHLLMGGLHGR